MMHEHITEASASKQNTWTASDPASEGFVPRGESISSARRSTAALLVGSIGFVGKTHSASKQTQPQLQTPQGPADVSASKQMLTPQ